MSKSFFVFVFVPPIHHSPSLHSGAPQADQYAAYDHMMLSAETLSLTSPTSRWAWRWLKSSPPPSLGPVPPARLAPDKASPPAPPARLAPESWHGNSTWSTCWQFLSPNSQASWQNFRHLQGEEVALLLVGVLETFLVATINCIAMGQKVLWWQIKTQSDYYCQRIKQTKVRHCCHYLPLEMRNSQQNALCKIVVV